MEGKTNFSRRLKQVDDDLTDSDPLILRQMYRTPLVLRHRRG